MLTERDLLVELQLFSVHYCHCHLGKITFDHTNPQFPQMIIKTCGLKRYSMLRQEETQYWFRTTWLPASQISRETHPLHLQLCWTFRGNRRNKMRNIPFVNQPYLQHPLWAQLPTFRLYPLFAWTLYRKNHIKGNPSWTTHFGALLMDNLTRTWEFSIFLGQKYLMIICYAPG